ncbi:MAG: phospho-N-acetylmuramoyl-pentapeptide-transferase [Clostridia bacterium]|nr:phospho-N-acetylmuramoyl-pentapeptide-transferase [Clostridia bacterium]
MNTAFSYTVIGLFTISFLLTVVFSRLLIPVLRRRHAGQPILEIGPSWHLSKAGTPTLGGLAFIGGILGAFLLLLLFYLPRESAGPLRRLGAVLLYAVLCALIGLVDDGCKLFKHKNQGLTAPQKYFLQLLAAAIFLFVAVGFLGIDTTIKVPFFDTVWRLNHFYYPLALLYLTGLTNALNLTDGVDGLLSVTVAVISVFFLAWGYVDGQDGVMMVGALLLGGSLGFLCFNAHPAKVFMGDTGSLFLGGAVSAVGILTAHPLLVLLAGGVFLVETVSVILQVVWFKLSHGKRLFRMAPLHHHLEKGGWSEWQVVSVLGLGGVVCAALAFLGR